MANVIPPDVKKQLRSVARARFILATAIVALISAAVVSLMLLPSWFALAQHSSGASSGTIIPPSQQALDKTALNQTNTLLSQLAPITLASTTLSEAIISAVGARPTGISIDQVTYSAGKTATLVLYGSAKSTAQISAYRAALASSTIFTSATVPVNALIGAEDGRFTLTLTGNF